MSKMNLLPEGYLRQRLQYRVDMLCVLLFGIVMVSIMTAETISSRQIEETRATYERVTQRESEAAEEVKRYFDLVGEKNRMMKEAQVISAIAERVPRSLILAAVTNMCPTDVTLTSVTLVDSTIMPVIDEDEKKRRKRMSEEELEKEKAKQPPPETQLLMTVTGLSMQYSQITQLLNALKNSPLMEDVDIDFTRERPMNDRVLLDFRMECKLKPTAELVPLINDRESTGFLAPSREESAGKPANSGVEVSP